MKAGKYTIKDLFYNRYIHQIIIPEIQRDYVWQGEQVKGLLDSLLSDFEKFVNRKMDAEIISQDTELVQAFNEFYLKRKFTTNIGFIYAYNDEQYVGKYFLIDGQQRITTIYLILLVLASQQKELAERFRSTYITHDALKLDYKVRESAHHFMQKLVNGLLEGDTDFRDSNYYFDNLYDSDVTIQSVISNVERIGNSLNRLKKEEQRELYDYIESQVEFWYFDTNVSEQGEELYIYMNARGEQMQSNENLKADLLGKLVNPEEKNEFGRVWEGWQDFFWRRRGENSNSDKGFNQFLTCIAGLEYYCKQDNTIFYSKQKFDRLGGVRTTDLVRTLDLNIIKEYLEVFQFLFEKKEVFCQSRMYSEWLEKALNLLWSQINSSTINWFANYNDRDRSAERRAMVFVWSVLLFVKERKKSVLHIDEVYRLLRIYYIRYNNNIRGVVAIRNEVSRQVNSGIWKESNYIDEKYKFDLFEKCAVNERNTLEELIWQIEDHPLNLNGQDVENINISHLVDFNQTITIQYLELVKETFYQLFPINENDYHRIKHILLHYGRFYEETSPYYYKNLKFDNWRRIIRNLGNYLVKGETPFFKFFSEFMYFQGTFEQFTEQKDKENKMEKATIDDQHDRLLWYSQKLGERMWQQGGTIAISKGNPCSLEDWDSVDPNFPSEYIFYNTKGDLKGGTPKAIHTLIHE